MMRGLMSRQRANNKPTATANGGSYRYQPKRALTCCLLSVVCCLLSSPLWATTSLDNYVQRVEVAAKLASDVVDNDYSRAEEDDLLRRITELLPATEDVARDASGKDVTHVDNSWLHQALKTLDQADEDARYTQLAEMAERLATLGRRLRATVAQQSLSEANPTRERLQQILARAEYQPEEKKDSAIQGWLRKIRQKINELLARLFFRNSSTTAPSPGSLQVIRWFIIAALLASLAWAAVLLLRRLQLRQAKLQDDESAEDVREILGEEFAADVTAEDLIKSAAELARKGEYRLAIRRAYLAVLYELEQRGKLRLHRAKTNRDYLGELKHEQYIYPPVSALTNSYERVWYGYEAATLEDYAGFIEKYREVAR
jgi:hypothetical protein